MEGKKPFITLVPWAAPVLLASARKKPSALLISAHAAALTLNPGRQLSPAQLPYPDIPWHRISLGGESHATSPALHLSLASCKKHYGIYGVIPTMSAAGLSAETASGLCWSSHAPQNTASPSFFPSTWVGFPQGEVMQKQCFVLGLKKQPFPVPSACYKLTLCLW